MTKFTGKRRIEPGATHRMRETGTGKYYKSGKQKRTKRWKWNKNFVKKNELKIFVYFHRKEKTANLILTLNHCNFWNLNSRSAIGFDEIEKQQPKLRPVTSRSVVVHHRVAKMKWRFSQKLYIQHIKNDFTSI